MQALPTPVFEYVFALTIENRNPSYILIGRDGRLKDLGGDPVTYGFGDLRKGQDVADHVPFLEGILPLDSDDVVLNSIEMPSGLHADVHLLSREEGDWVLLLDATEETRQRRLVQQKGNELTLLRDQLLQKNRDLDAANARIQESYERLEAEKEKSERLLLSIFPKLVADRLRQETGVIAESLAEATVLFANINDFSSLALQKTPMELVKFLGDVFSAFDRIVEENGLEKIKTIGDAYMAAGGIPLPREDHAEAVAELALAMQNEVVQMDTGTGEQLQLRIGINSGPVIAGVIGTVKLAYDLWGEAVNTAAQMQLYGLPGCIQVTAATYERLQDTYHFDERGEFYVEGEGSVRTYLLTGRKGPG